MALPPNVLNNARTLMSGMSNYRGPGTIQNGATKPGLAQNFASKGFTMPGGLVDKPSQDAYMKAKMGTLGGYSTVDQARIASAQRAKALYEARNMPVPVQITDILAGNYGKDHAGETMSAPALNPQGQPWSKPQGYAPSYQNLRLAAAQDVLSGQPNGGAPAWAREAAAARAPGSVSPAPATAAPTYSAQPPGLRYSPEDMQRELERIRGEGMRWTSGNRPEYMQNQSAFERMRAQSVYNLLGRRPNVKA